jgi:hypothetical protein
MADYTIDRTTSAEAASVLRAILQVEIPTGDFTDGSPLGALLVDGHAIVAGFFGEQIRLVRERQSLLTLQNLPETESVSDAVDAILQNFFRTRAQGSFAKGIATLHFSAKVDVLIPRAARFFKTTTQVFYVDSESDVFIPSTEMRPNVDPNGLLLDYTVTVALTAARTGADYNVAAGRFVAFDPFNSFLTYVENLAPFTLGKGLQTTQEFVAESTNAIALRALINARSNDALLLDNFVDIEATLTIGYGDAEMIRDYVRNVANALPLHVGGHMDVFVRQPVQETVQRLEIGAEQRRNDNRIVVFRDSAPPSGSFVAAGVKVGYTLVILSGIPEAPMEYRIAAVRPTELDVDTRVPFSVATDEDAIIPAIAYKIGNNYPAFNQIVVAATTTARTSRRFSEQNRVELAGGPVYRIKSVVLLAPPPSMSGFVNTPGGNVNFTARKNAPTLVPPTVTSPIGYYVEVKNPEENQSNRAITMVEVGWPAVNLNGSALEVTYDTQAGFDLVDDYVTDRLNRPACSNTLLRAFHPIYVYASIPYRPRTTPVSPLSTVVPTFNRETAQNELAAFVNNYRATEPLDVTTIATETRTVTNGAIASLYAFAATYELFLPNGKVMRFTTTDQITIFPDGVTNSAKLTNPTDFGFSPTSYYGALKKYLTDLGVSDRVTRYRAVNGAIALVTRS